MNPKIFLILALFSSPLVAGPLEDARQSEPWNLVAWRNQVFSQINHKKPKSAENPEPPSLRHQFNYLIERDISGPKFQAAVVEEKEKRND